MNFQSKILILYIFSLFNTSCTPENPTFDYSAVSEQHAQDLLAKYKGKEHELSSHALSFFLKTKETPPAIKQKVKEWDTLCQQHKNYNCRLSAYFHKKRGLANLAQRNLEIACNGLDFIACYALFHDPTRDAIFHRWAKRKIRLGSLNLKKPEATHYWGKIIHSEGKIAKAESTILKNCENGHFRSCSLYAFWMETKRPESALFYYQKSCQKNIVLSCINLAKIYHKQGKSSQSTLLFSDLCKKDVAEGCYFLALEDYLGGRFGKSNQLAKKSCHLGDTKGCNLWKKSYQKEDHSLLKKVRKLF